MSDSSRISRQFSLRAVMQAIVQAGPISRASIAKQTDLSKQTVSEIIRVLEIEGWVRETGRTSGHVGRSAITYELVVDAAHIFAVDLGGTKVRAAITDLAGRILHEDVAPTDPRGGLELIGQIAAMSRQAAGAAGIALDKLKLAVIGVPGAPDQASGQVLMAPNIPDFDRIDVSAALERALGFGVMLENDVNLAALGENWAGSGKDLDNMVYIALGTGIGSGLIINGELVRGAGGAAGEIAFLPIGADPFAPRSLEMGALESTIGTHGIADRYRAMTGCRADVRSIFDAAVKGEAEANLILDEVAKHLASAIIAVCALLSPERVILGGSIGLRPEMLDRVRSIMPAGFPWPAEIGAGELGYRAAILGATALGLDQLHNTLFGVDEPGRRIVLPKAESISR